MIAKNRENKKLWVLKLVTDSDSSFQTIESYKDEIDQMYNYDNKVANSKQIKAGDMAIIIDKTKILGFATINNIATTSGLKTIKKCPECGSSTIDVRKTQFPKYRCNKGHSFLNPDEKEVAVIRFSANYSNTFVPFKDQDKIKLSALRPYYTKGYNQNMSIQLLSDEAIELFSSEYVKQFIDTSIAILSPEIGEELADYTDDDFIPKDIDERESIKRQIKARRGQQKFRNDLRDRYGDKCMITGCFILDILEAAHIKPYRGENDNHPANGLLLRTDIHTLFDLNLIGIEPKSLKISIANELKPTEYAIYENKTLGISLWKPDIKSLCIRWSEFANYGSKNKISKK